MRSIAPGQSPAWSVVNTRCPVSEARSAVRTVSMSRISPTRITSGSCRIASTRASLKLRASRPTWRWLTSETLDGWRNSIGSSIVTMKHSRVELMPSISVASVVDLPLPVGPVTITRPSRSWQNSAMRCGSPSSFLERKVLSRRRRATDVRLCWRKRLKR